MVAVAGKGWKLAPSLKLLVDEFDKVFPQRDRSSDGSIGDQAHASRESDHNPYDGWVHAVDIDEDVAAGRDLAWFAAELETCRDPRVRYVIYEGRILKAYPSNGLPAWSWHRYTGPNAHEHHLHLSIVRTAQARDDLRPWPVEPLGDDMGLSEVQDQRLVNMEKVGINTEARVGHLEDQLDKLAAKVDRISAGGVDPDVLAGKVADLLAKRLKD